MIPAMLKADGMPWRTLERRREERQLARFLDRSELRKAKKEIQSIIEMNIEPYLNAVIFDSIKRAISHAKGIIRTRNALNVHKNEALHSSYAEKATPRERSGYFVTSLRSILSYIAIDPKFGVDLKQFTALKTWLCHPELWRDVGVLNNDSFKSWSQIFMSLDIKSLSTRALAETKTTKEHIECSLAELEQSYAEMQMLTKTMEMVNNDADGVVNSLYALANRINT